MLLKLSRKRQIFFERALIHTRHVVLEGLPPTSGANKLVNFKKVAFRLNKYADDDQFMYCFSDPPHLMKTEKWLVFKASITMGMCFYLYSFAGCIFFM